MQELERLDIATKTAIKTSLVELSSGSRTCVEITVTRTPRFVFEQLAVSAGGGGGGGEGSDPGVGLVATGEVERRESAAASSDAAAAAGEDGGDGAPQLKENDVEE